MTQESQQWEKELKAAGWQPLAAHPNSPVWRAPDGQLHAGPGWAWLVMQEQRKNNDEHRASHQS